MNRKFFPWVILLLLFLSLIPFVSQNAKATITQLSLAATSIGDANQISHYELGYNIYTFLYAPDPTVKWLRNLYVISNHTYQYGVISNVTVSILWSNSDDNGDGNITIKTHGTEYKQGSFAMDHTGDLIGTTYWHNWTMNTNPNTAAAWTWAEVDDLQTGIALKRDVDTGVAAPYVEQMYVNVNYTTSLSVTTNSATSIEETTATLNGVAIGDNGLTGGFWYNTSTTRSSNPGNNVTCTGTYNSGSAFTKDVTGLTRGEYYYCRAWATKTGVGFFNATSTEKNFLTKPIPPTALTCSNLTYNTFRVKWTNSSIGTGTTRTNMIRYKTTGYPTSITDGTLLYNSSALNYTTLTGWTRDTTYYFSMWSYVKDGSPVLQQYSDTYNTTSYTTPTKPINLAVTSISNSTIGLSWSKGTGNTVIVRNTTGYPATPNSGTKVYNSTAETFTDSGLNPSKKYYYRAWDWNGVSYSVGYTNVSQYTRPNKPYNLNKAVVGGNSLNITWLNGTGSHRTIIRKSTSSQPVLPTDGTSLYNGTLHYKVDSSILANNFYTLFSWNATTGLYSDPEPLSWYIVWINCYDENGSAAVSPFSVFISNQTGTQTYMADGCTNPHLVNISAIPKGSSCTITGNATGYYTRTFTQTINPVGNYYINMFLTKKNASELYLLSVINQANQPINEVSITVMRYINETFGYENVSVLSTDGYGQSSVFLMPFQSYKFKLEKTGYTTSYSDWVPSDSLFTHTFMLSFETIIPQPPVLDNEMILFTGTYISANKTIMLYYNDTSGYTIYANIIIKMYNSSTNTTSIIGNYNHTSQVWYRYITNINRNNTYIVNLTYDNTYLGVNHRVYVLEMLYITPTTPARAEGVFSWVGIVPFGITNFLMFLFFMATMYYVDSRDAGKIVMVDGVIFLFVGVLIGFNDTLLNVAGVSFPVLFIVIGILMEWNEAKKRGN